MSFFKLSSFSCNNRSPSTLLSVKLGEYFMNPICFTHSSTSSQDHSGTCWLSLCGTTSPISLSACAAYLDATAFGQLATFFSCSTAPISAKMSVFPCCFLIPASMQKWKAAKFLASSRFEFKTGTNCLSHVLLCPWACARFDLANSEGLWVVTKGSTRPRVPDCMTSASISAFATSTVIARQA